jgi:hypothetical protein
MTIKLDESSEQKSSIRLSEHSNEQKNNYEALLQKAEGEVRYHIGVIFIFNADFA